MAAGSDKRILIVGFGNMGRALVRGWLDAGMAAELISVADQSQAAIEQARAWGLRISDISESAPSDRCDFLVLAVKPPQIDAAIQHYAAALSDTGVVLSIAAGRKIDSMQQLLGPDAAIVRSMPNTPAAIARGTTVLCANESVSVQQREICSQLLRAVGTVFWIDDEALFDAVTAVSGSGPAYVFLLIECLTAAGVRQGLSDALAADLALQTVAGAGAYALDSQTPVSELRAQVTSPGGTTAAALGELMRNDALQELVNKAVAAAAARSAELSAE